MDTSFLPHVAINGTGNALDNRIVGNNANNILDGKEGADTMIGGGGNDTYIVDNNADQVIEQDRNGIDTVHASISYTLGQHVENLTLTGTANLGGTGNALDNHLIGNAGHNHLLGWGGNDILDGGAGNDVLIGGSGNDTYRFGRGSEFDVIVESDTQTNNTDVLEIGTGVTTEQLWFTRDGDHLNVSIIGTDDKIAIKNHYLGTQYQVEKFKTADGKTLDVNKVDALVAAMANFSTPAAGSNTLPEHYLTALTPVIAANWS